MFICVISYRNCNELYADTVAMYVWGSYIATVGRKYKGSEFSRNTITYKHYSYRKDTTASYTATAYKENV